MFLRTMNPNWREMVQYLRDSEELTTTTMRDELDELIKYYKQCMDIEVKDERSVISTGLFIWSSS